MKLLIVGCPHSGTMFTARVLQAAGLSCGHEAIYTLYGHVSDVAVDVEVSWEAVFHFGTVAQHVVVAHQTRDPIAWLNSWSRMSEHAGVSAWALLDKVYPGIHARQTCDPARTAMWLWVEMNRRCERRSTRRHRVEDLRGDQGCVILGELAREADVDVAPDRLRAALAVIDLDTNHHPGLPTYVASTWGSLPAGIELDEFRNLARTYGYSTSS
jgi:hypothetical protein